METTLRVVIADDNIHFRSSLSNFLSQIPVLSIVGEAVDGQNALDLVDQTSPDLVILDLRMPNLNGFECTKYIKSHHPGAFVLILSLHDAQTYRDLALEAGADAFVSKSEIPKSLTREIMRCINLHSPSA